MREGKEGGVKRGGINAPADTKYNPSGNARLHKELEDSNPGTKTLKRKRSHQSTPGVRDGGDG